MIHPSSKLVMTLLAAAVCVVQATAQTNKTPAAPGPAAASPAAPKPDKMKELFGDPAIARGPGFEVKRSDLDTAMTGIRSASAARGQPLSVEYGSIMEKRVLEQLIQIQILLQKATPADKAKGQESVDKRFAEMLKRAGSQETFERQLKSVGLTPDEMRARMTEESVAEAVVEREMSVKITDEDVKKFYDEHPSRFEQPESVRVAQIFMATRDSGTGEPLSEAQKEAKRKKLDGALKRARGGEDFTKLAKEFSEDTEVKTTGGELPIFSRDSMPRTPEFEAAAFSLGTNQVSDVVTTLFGYHVIKLLEKIPAKKIELATVATNLKESLRQQEMLKQLPAYSEKLKKEFKVEILDEKLKLRDTDVLPPAGAPPAVRNRQ